MLNFLIQRKYLALKNKLLVEIHFKSILISITEKFIIFNKAYFSSSF